MREIRIRRPLLIRFSLIVIFLQNFLKHGSTLWLCIRLHNALKIVNLPLYPTVFPQGWHTKLFPPNKLQPTVVNKQHSGFMQQGSSEGQGFHMMSSVSDRVWGCGGKIRLAAPTWHQVLPPAHNLGQKHACVLPTVPFFFLMRCLPACFHHSYIMAPHLFCLCLVQLIFLSPHAVISPPQPPSLSLSPISASLAGSRS